MNLPKDYKIIAKVVLDRYKKHKEYLIESIEIHRREINEWTIKYNNSEEGTLDHDRALQEINYRLNEIAKNERELI